MATEISDLNIIQDEDTLRRMWQQTEDVSRKKEIRLRMYRLREERLKSYYITRDSSEGTVNNCKSAASSHAESISDHGFLTAKTKEIRDSASPILEFRQSNVNLIGHVDHDTNQNITQLKQISEDGFTSKILDTQKQNQFSTIPHEEAGIVVTHNSENKKEHFENSMYATSAEHYSSSSKRESVTVSSTQNNQKKKTNIDYNTGMTRQINKQNINNENVDSRTDTANKKMKDHNSKSNNMSHHRVTETRDSQLTTNTKDNDCQSSLRQSVYEDYHFQPRHESITTHSSNMENITIQNDENRKKDNISTVISETRSNIEENQNVNKSIMNELHKLDSFLSTEAIASPQLPLSPSSVTTETWNINKIDDDKIIRKENREISLKLKDTTDYTSSQEASSKISVDISATHNAFASSLRASPERNNLTSSKRSSSKSSLERSSPEKTPRVSPEKISNYDLSKKFTASFQNRITTSNRNESKSSSPAKQNISNRKKTKSSTSEYDSDDTSITDNKKKKITNKSTIEVENKQENMRQINTTTHDISHTSSTSTTKSLKKTHESTKERQNSKNLKNSPDVSPERSAFKPVSSTNIRSINGVQKTQTQMRRQSSPQVVSTTNLSEDKSLKKKLMHEERSKSEKINIAQQSLPDKKLKTNLNEIKVKETVSGYPSSNNFWKSSKQDHTNLKTESQIKESVFSKQIKNNDIIDVDEEENIEEINVNKIAKITKIPKKEASPNKTIKNEEKPSVQDKKYRKNPIKKKRSKTCTDISIQNGSTKSVRDESTDESSSSMSNGSDSDEEREKVTIEEIVDDNEQQKNVKKINEDQICKLIKTDNEIIQEKLLQKNIPLIPQEKTNMNESPKAQTEVFIQQEKITQDGELDGTLPDIENFSEKDADKAILNEYIKREQKHCDELLQVENTKLLENIIDDGNLPCTEFDKSSDTTETRSKVSASKPKNFVLTVNTERKTDELKISDNKDQFKKNTKKESTEFIKKEKKLSKITSVPMSDKKLTKGTSRTTITHETKFDKLKDTKYVKLETDKNSRTVIKQINNGNLYEKKDTDKIKTPMLINRTDLVTKVRKQDSDKYLKEKNTIEQKPRKLKTDQKTKSESSIKQNTRLNMYQRRATDQIKPLPTKTESEQTRTKISDTPQRLYKTTFAVTATKSISPTKVTPKLEKPLNRDQTLPKTISVKFTNGTTPKKYTSNSSAKIIRTSSETKSQDKTTISLNKTKTHSQNIKQNLGTKTPPEFTIKSTKDTQKSNKTKIPNRISKSKIIITETINTVQNDIEKKKSSISSSSSSISLIDLNEVSTIEDEIDVCVEAEENNQRTKTQNEISSNQKETHLNVIVRMPSSSRETTPNKQTEELFCTITDEEGVPRYADRVVMPEDAEVLNKRVLSNMRFEKITDLDDESSEIETSNITIAERMNKFLENAKETSTKQTIIEDDLFQNREQAVFKTKEIFETIAKNQSPKLTRSPPIIQRPSVFEHKPLRETIEEEMDGQEGRDNEHKVVSKKLTNEDYDDYIKSKNKNTVLNDICEVDENIQNNDNIIKTDVNKIAQNFEIRATEYFKNDTKLTKISAKPITDSVASTNSTLTTDIKMTVALNQKQNKTNVDDGKRRKSLSSPTNEVCSPKQSKFSHSRETSPTKGTAILKHLDTSSTQFGRDSLIKEDHSSRKYLSSSNVRQISPTKEQDTKNLTSASKTKNPLSPNTKQTSLTKEIETTKSIDALSKSGRSFSTKATITLPSRSRQTSPNKDVSPHAGRISPTKNSDTEKSPNRNKEPIKALSSCSRKTSLVENTVSKCKDSSFFHKPSSVPVKEKRIELISSSRETSPKKDNEFKRPTFRSEQIASKENTIQTYETCKKSPIKGKSSVPLKLKPIEITTVEVKPSKQIFEHTAITKVNMYPDENIPIKETFNEVLTKSGNERILSGRKKSTTERTKQAFEKLSSPDKIVSKGKCKSESPSPTRSHYKSKSSSPVKEVIIGKNQKSPSPEKTTNKLRNKFQMTRRDSELKRKEFEKRITTTGNDYQNRKKFFETKSREDVKNKNVAKMTSFSSTKCETKIGTTNVVIDDDKTSFSKLKSKDDKTENEFRKSPERQSIQKSESRRTLEESNRPIHRPHDVKNTARSQTTEAKRKSPEKSIKKNPFGVTLRKTSSTTNSNTFVVKQKITSEIENENEKKVEEIFDLELLEKMLEKATKYDIRSRIRAQIRLIKRQSELKKTSRTPSPEKSLARENNKFSKISTSQIDGKITKADQPIKAKKRLFTNESENKSYQSNTIRTESKYEKPARSDDYVKISATNRSERIDHGTYKADFGSSLTNSNETKPTTESIISGYGVGPTDENGRPLFGLKALRTSSEAKFTEEDLDRNIKVQNEYKHEIADNSGKPLFGIKALQRKSAIDQQNDTQYDMSLFSCSNAEEKNATVSSNDYHTVSSESSSRVYSFRSAMQSDSSGNISVLRDEVKGELFSKDGKEPTGKMTSTSYSYQKPENGEATIKTKTTTNVLNAKERSNDSHVQDAVDKTTNSKITSKYFPNDSSRKLSNSAENENWKSKFSSSSLIRKISNEHFEKAQRKFSNEETTVNEDEHKRNLSDTKDETRHKSFSKTDNSLFSTRYLLENTHAKREYFDENSHVDECNSKISLPVSVSCSYEENSNQTVGRSNSFKDIKNKFQQATVSSSLKQVTKSTGGQQSPTKLKPEIKSIDESAKFQPEVHSKGVNYETNQFFENKSNFAESNFSTIYDHSNEQKEVVSPFSKFTSGSVSLRELDHVPKSTGSNENNFATTKAASLVKQFEKQQNKTKQSENEINIDQIWDEDQLRNLLEACTDYESRRLIRVRLRTIMAENKTSGDVISANDNTEISQKNETFQTTSIASSRSDSFSSSTKVHKTSTNTRMVKANSVTSPFAKFRQLERQNSLPSSGAPIFKYTDPKLTRSTTSIKDRLLNWVKAQTKDYKNVQIDNFSTSWNNGLAFCALIHHFCPHAFDYNQLTPEHRRYNFELAFKVAEEEAGIVPLLDVEDMVIMIKPDWKCVFTYVQSVYQRFHATPEAVRP